MELSELKAMKIADLNKVAKELDIEDYSGMPRQDLIFKILEKQTEKDGLIFAQGAGNSAGWLWLSALGGVKLPAGPG